MNNQEGIDLVKMAVQVLLITLLIGAVLSLFYLLYIKSDAHLSNMENATNSASMERVYELSDASLAAQDALTGVYDLDALPLCTNMVSCLYEFDSDDLLFIEVISGGSPTIYTYTDVTQASLNVPAGITFVSCEVPTMSAAKQLLKSSNKRCTVEVITTNYGNMTLSALVIGVVD